MIDMAVHPAIRKQPHQVQSRSLLLCIGNSIEKLLLFKEISVINRLCDARQLLIYNAPSADIEMPYFAVAHLAIRQAYR